MNEPDLIHKRFCVKQACSLICLLVAPVAAKSLFCATDVRWWFHCQQWLENTPNKSITQKVTHRERDDIKEIIV